MQRFLRMFTAIAAVLLALCASPAQAQQSNVDWVVPDNVAIMYIRYGLEDTAEIQVRNFIESVGKQYEIRSVALTTKVRGQLERSGSRNDVYPRSEINSVVVVVGPKVKRTLPERRQSPY